MLFNSYIFILFFLPTTVSIYFLINKYKKNQDNKLDLWWLFGMSLWFYGYSNPIYLILILSSICVNFWITGKITLNRRSTCLKRAKYWMLSGVLFNLALIFYFKYYDFFITNMNVLFQEDWTLKNLALPLGISFFTFQQVSYVVDCYREKKLVQYKFIEYAAYVTFFPQLVAGPIVMHSELVPQMQDKAKKKMDFENMSQGLYALALGLGKKVLIADTLSKIVSVGYADISSLNRISAIVIMVSYTLQIYFDFSGYCDMALGMSKMFNIELPFNFNSPYKAKTVSEFWARWHMTLTRFFTHYVYIPMGGSRKGKIRTYLNTMIVFLLSGIWHGANWTFILWGIIHGAFMTMEKVIKDLLGINKKSYAKNGSVNSERNDSQTIDDKKIGIMIRKGCNVFRKILGSIYVFIFVNLTWVLFRAESIEQAKIFFIRLKVSGGGIASNIIEKVGDLVEIRMLYRLGFGRIMEQYRYLPCTLILVILWIAVFFMKNTQEKIRSKKYGVMRSLVTIFLIVWSVISLSDVSEFLYFNF